MRLANCVQVQLSSHCLQKKHPLVLDYFIVYHHSPWLPITGKTLKFSNYYFFVAFFSFCFVFRCLIWFGLIFWGFFLVFFPLKILNVPYPFLIICWLAVACMRVPYPCHPGVFCASLIMKIAWWLQTLHVQIRKHDAHSYT